MNGIDPKWGAYLGLAVIIEQGIGHGTVSLTNLIPVDWAPYVTSWANFLAFVGTSIMTYQAAVSGPQKGPLADTPLAPAAKPVIVLAVLMLGLWSNPASAQGKVKIPFDPLGLNGAAAKVQSVVTGQPAPDPTAALPCDFKMLVRLTPDNLIPTVKACLSDVNSKFVVDTQRALDSATAYAGTATGSTATAATGDGDAINCLKPALAIFKAGVQVPAIPAVMSADGTTVVTPAVPAQDPGPILLYQKYREFTLSGALTACQAWFNGPINATAAAGIAGAGTALGAAALLAPK